MPLWPAIELSRQGCTVTPNAESAPVMTTPRMVSARNGFRGFACLSGFIPGQPQAVLLILSHQGIGHFAHVGGYLGAPVKTVELHAEFFWLRVASLHPNGRCCRQPWGRDCPFRTSQRYRRLRGRQCNPA